MSKVSLPLCLFKHHDNNTYRGADIPDLGTRGKRVISLKLWSLHSQEQGPPMLLDLKIKSVILNTNSFDQTPPSKANKFHTFHGTRTMTRALGQLNPVHTLTSHFFQIYA